ncbi:hypothetical protein BZG35_05700 [Brevundimonas sp. LM2]|uniref:heparinase II/III family protein n=1 Tax=Brevundimonas sp. LM2 TaxID=1938605 RepID=UPI00098400B9|nr:heparinase II/III family protein [Brevundimonas sp. LM2]AQR61202.1 hypothetical protein BZG35_05700 [Brevundimonas sp. LM2]
MPSFRSLGVAVRAASYVPPLALLHHLRRRVRARLIPLRGAAFEVTLETEASRLPPVAASPSAAAARAAETVAMYFAAKQAKNVPQCFDGKFTFLNRTHDFGGADKVDWRIDMDGGRYQLWRANLSFMGYLSPAIDADPKRGLALSAVLARSFRRFARFDRSSVFSDAWNSYPVSQRILALGTALIRLPTELRGTEDARVTEDFLRFNVAYLLRNLETELGFNHLERNLSALAIYALASGETPPAVRKAILANFDHVVGETIGEDGVQLERSPMYQGLTIQSLRVFRELDIWTPDQAALIARRLQAAEAALAAMTLGDDRPSLMNDGWFDEAPRASQILGDYRVPGFVALRDAGYVRLARDGAVALFDAGPIGPDANPGHGHPDFLSLEMTLNGARLLVDPGTSGYSADAGRQRDRSWDQHNGPSITGGTPVEFLGSFKVGRRVAAVLDAADETEGVQRAAGSLRFGDVVVRRDVSLTGSTLTLADRWESGAGERVARFLVPSEWTAADVGPTGLTLERDGQTVRLSVSDARLSIADSRWSCRYNLSEPAHEIVVRPVADRATTMLTWV